MAAGDAARHDRASARRRRSRRRRSSTRSSSTSRTPKGSPRRRSVFATMRPCAAGSRSRDARWPSATTTAFSTPPGASCSAGSSIDASEAMDASRARFLRYVRAAGRWARLLTGGQPGPGVRVFYGHDHVPAPGEPVAGRHGEVPAAGRPASPTSPTDFSLLYLGSTWLPRDLSALLWHVRRRRIPLLLNQNGVGYPGWAGSGTEAFNRPLRTVLGAAEHVLYQSAVLQARGGRARRPSLPARGRSCTTPSTSGTSRRRSSPPRTGRSCSSEATSTRPTASSSGSRRSRRSCRRIPTRSSSSRGGS